MQVITIFNEKGGVGKTTLTGIIGAGLALKGYKVLLIDADQQGDLTKNMGLPRQAGFFRLVKWADKESPDYVDVRQIIQRVPPDNCSGELYIVPGNNDSAGVPLSMNLTQMVRNLTIRFKALERVFDYVLVDTQPSSTTLHDGLGFVARYFICPTDCEALSAFGGLISTIDHIADIREQVQARGFNRAELLGIIPNKFRKTVLHQHIVEKLKETHGELVFEPIPERICIPESQYVQATLMQDAPELRTNDHLWKLIDRIESDTKERA